LLVSGARLLVPISPEAGLFPLPIVCRHPGQTPVFSLADLFGGRTCRALRVSLPPLVLFPMASGPEKLGDACPPLAESHGVRSCLLASIAERVALASAA